jgi:flagellar hook-associated protein 3 FlgL
MRITNKVMVKGYLSNLRTNLEEMRKKQEQLSSGHQVQRPSDDPFRVARTMELTASIGMNERYGKNIDEGLGWVNTIDSALGQIGDAIQTIREKTVAGGNGSYTEDERKALATHIQQLKEQIAHTANSSYDGRYVLAGDKTTEPPFKLKGDATVVYQGSSNGLNKEMSPGVTMDIAVLGSSFSNNPVAPPSEPSENGLFKVISDIVNKLNLNESPSDELDNLDKELNSILRIRAEVGAKQKRLEDMKSKSELESFNMTELLSKTYDVDLAQVVMEAKVMESIYTASLNVGARVLQPSLLDFLR